MPAAEVETMVEQARGTFSLGSYAVASASTALVTGVVLSAIIMLFLRGHPTNAFAAPPVASLRSATGNHD
jgi:hypothetical protein